jgi:RNA polymerase sigma-70 factor (ECF subfamily)
MTTNTVEMNVEQLEAAYALPDARERPEPPLISNELVARAQQGDESAIAEVLALVRPVVYRAASRLSSDMASTEDIADIGIGKILEKGLMERKYRPDNFAGWAFRVVTNSARDYNRKQKVRRTVPLDGVFDIDKMLPAPAAVSENDRLGVSSENIRRIMSQAGVSDELAIPFILHHVDGFSDKEIADILGVRLPTVRTRIHRARYKARTFYESHPRPDVA